MREQKKYPSIARYGHRSTIGLLQAGDLIVIQEKIDGANASFMVENGVIRAFSRNTELDESNTLGGFYQYTQSLNKHELVEGALYFGEWTNRHKVYYPEHEKQFFLFDVYDHILTFYHDFEVVEYEAKRLGMNLVPVLYKGVYVDFNHLQSFVGQTRIGGELCGEPMGEGIVVKKLFDNNVFVKLVGDQFREVHGGGQKAPKDPVKVATQEQIFVNDTVTQARVEKLLFKLVDEGILDERFGLEDMGTILKNLNARVIEDILKEESESLPEDYDEKQISKAVARKVPNMVKKAINERGVEGV